jgi:hypothetical protein
VDQRRSGKRLRELVVDVGDIPIIHCEVATALLSYDVMFWIQLFEFSIMCLNVGKFVQGASLNFQDCHLVAIALSSF